MPSLDTVADIGTVSESDARQERRAARFAARQVLHRESRKSRIQKCGKLPFDAAQGVSVKVTGHGSERRAGFGGVVTCGSVWACPVCSESIQSQRRAELQQGLRTWRENGGYVAFVTLTMRHSKRDGLGELWLALSKAWTRTVAGWGGWKAEREALGVAGYVRTVEAPYSDENGWHLHVHCLMFLTDTEGARESGGTAAACQLTRQRLGLSDERARRVEATLRGYELADGMFNRWQRALRPLGLTPVKAFGLDVQVLTAGNETEVADYFTKAVYRPEAAASFEVTGSHAKKGRSGSRTPFEILSDVVARRSESLDTETGEIVQHPSADDLALWHEWERVSAGKRQLTWSRHLRDWLQLGDELTDEEIVERDELQGEVLEWLTAAEFGQLRRRGQLAHVLNLAERDDGGHSLAAFLIRSCNRPMFEAARRRE